MAAQRKGMLPWKGVTVFLLACSLTGAVGDVPDGVVYTDLHKTVLKGNTTILKCEFFGDPIAVYWTKGDDPDQGTSLISWVEGSNPSGSCVTDNACDMGDDYSLIIRDAQISDQGRYICQVSNYLGILIHNYTDVKIYAPPEEPFPVIDKCADRESSVMNSTQPCYIQPNTSTVSITCTVIKYYPALELFFLQGSHKIPDTLTKKWNNHDGTKNKSISIKASASDSPYVCVASNIPGSNDQRAATILVKSLRPTDSTITATQGSPTSSIKKGGKIDTPKDNNTAKIAVPIVVIMVIIVGIGLVMIFVFHRRKLNRAINQNQHSLDQTTDATVSIERNDTEERVPLLKAKIEGDISFYELWSLAYETLEDDKMRLHQVLIKLDITDAKLGLTTAKIYDLLCEWKEQNKIAELAEPLREALESADLESRWMQLCEQRKRTDSKVSQETLEQIVLGIENPDKIQQFLSQLIPNRPGKIDTTGKKIEARDEALIVIREWGRGPFEENPFASLSLALEASGCSPLDKTFFGEMISFFELWSLSHYLNDYDDTEEILSVFEELDLVIEDRLTREDLYYHLCSWKDSSKTISQGKCLRDALDKANLRKRWKDIKDLCKRDNTPVSQHTLEHILWHINDPKKIDDFLQRLTLDDPGMELDVTRGLRDTIRQAVIRLNMWTKKGYDENSLVLLSLALEKTGCCPIDRTFFKTPDALTQQIDEFKVQSFVDSLTSRHIKALTKCLDISKTEDTMTKENKGTIFKTESMISDWIAQEECSNYEKKWKLNKAVDSIGRQDLKDFFGEMNPAIHVGIDYRTSTANTKDPVQDIKVDSHRSDFINEEFQRIATYLSPSQLKDLFGDSADPRNADPRSAIQSFAEHRMTKKLKQDWREKLRKELKSYKFEDLIPSELEHGVYLCELLDVAFRLLLKDVYPLAKALGISDEKLREYSVDYAPDHLTKGNTASLIKFSEANDNDRSKICRVISDAGYTDIALLLEYGHETSLADEFAIASAACKKGDKGKVLAKISEKLGMSHSSITEGALRDWRSMVHPPAYNHRTSLADAVFPVLGIHVAISILSGQYRKNGNESSSVIQTIARGIESLDLHLIAKILDVKNARKLGTLKVSSQKTDFTVPSSTIEGESKQTDTGIATRFRTATALKIAQILGVAVLKFDQDTAILQVIEIWEEEMRKNPLSMNDRRDLSDKLLQAGFKEFAFEIMTGFVPRAKGKDRKRKKDEQEYQSNINQGKKGGKGNQVMLQNMQGEQDKKSNIGEQNKQGRGEGPDTINDYGNVEKAGLENKNNKDMIAESQPRLDNEQQAKKTATTNVQGTVTSKSEKNNGPKGSKQQLTSGNDVRQIGGIDFQHGSGNEGQQDRKDKMKEEQPSGDSEQLTGGNDGQQSNESEWQQHSGSDGQQDGQRPNGGDGQQPNGNDGQQTNGSEGNSVKGATGNNITEAMGNKLAESEVNNPSEKTATNSGNDDQPNK